MKKNYTHTYLYIVNYSVVNRPADVSAAIPADPCRWGLKSKRFPKSVKIR